MAIAAQRGKLCKVRHQIRADTGKVAAGFVRIAFHHAYGQVAFPHNAVAGAGDLCGQHLVELVAVFVQTIILVGQQDAALELGLIDAAVVIVILADAPESRAFSSSE